MADSNDSSMAHYLSVPVSLKTRNTKLTLIVKGMSKVVGAMNA